MMKLRARDKATARLNANTDACSTFCPGGIYTVKCYDKDGSLKWEEVEHNLFTNEGLDYILDVVFSDATQHGTHYIGLKGSGAAAAGDTLASHAGWSEVTDYSEGARQAWTEGGVSSQAITNDGNEASFSINGDATVAGAFLTNASSGTSGILYCVVDFTSARTVANGDTLTVQYDLSAADS